MTRFHYINGEIVPESTAYISVFDLGLLRSYAVFDYVQLYQGCPFHLKEHLQRLKKSAEQVQLKLPMSIEAMEKIALELIQKNEPIDAGIRFIVTAGLCGPDLLLPKNESTLIILFHPISPNPEHYYQSGMKAVTTPLLRYLPHVKTTNYMPAIFAKKYALEHQSDDALYIDELGGILEATTSNVFFIKDGTIITDDSDLIVKGITREIILNLAKPHFPIEYRALPIKEISSCDEAFLTSSIKDIIPLVKIDDQNVGNGKPGPISHQLRGLFHVYLQNYLSFQKVLL